MTTPDWLTALAEKAAKATAGPWRSGGTFQFSAVADDTWTVEEWPYKAQLPVGRCASCPNEPAPCARMETRDGKHYHVNFTDYTDYDDEGNAVPRAHHEIASERTTETVAGNYDYEQGGIVTDGTCRYLAACDPATIAALVEVAKAAVQLEDKWHRNVYAGDAETAVVEAVHALDACAAGRT